MQINIQKQVYTLINELSTPKKVTIIVHQNPDGDALGSSLGLYHYLTENGHQATVIIPNARPDYLRWLPGNDEIVNYELKTKLAKKLLLEADMLFCLDFNTPLRVDKAEDDIKQSKAFKVLIDHHPMPEDFADVTISDTSVSSTCELLYEVLTAFDAGYQLSDNSLTCLFSGIMTDTGVLRFNSSHPRTYEIVAQMIRNGLDKDLVLHKLLNNYSEDRMKFMGHCLNHNMVVFPEYHAAHLSFTMKEAEEFYFRKGDSIGFVNIPLSIKGINLSALFVEKEGYVKVSFRSYGQFDVNEFARAHFDGGGHTNAAGGKSKLSLRETIEKFEALLPKHESDLDY